MIIQEKLPDIAKLLLEAAVAKTTVGYAEFYKLFDRGDPALARLFELDVARQDNAKLYTLEAASRALACYPIYSSLFAKVEDGLPGIRFYDIFSKAKPSEYRRITSADHVTKLTHVERREIAELERERVYADAEVRFRSHD